MSDRILSFGSGAAAFAALILFSGQDSAQAARCPLGEIYRPSRGICVSKETAIKAGIYRAPAARDPTRAAQAPDPKPRAHALAAIERRAPIETARNLQPADALAYTTRENDAPAAVEPVRATKPVTAPVLVRTPIEPKRVKAIPVALERPEPSPFGSLVALEPMP